MMHGMEYTENRRMSKRSFTGRIVALLFSIVFVICCAAGSTIAWLSDSTQGLVNTFEPGTVTTTVEENFNGVTKSNVHVKVVADTNVYVRVKLVTYMADENGNVIGSAKIPEFTLGNDWLLGNDGYYYYKLKVAPDASSHIATTTDLIDSCTLEKGQVLTILAEAIQSDPIDAAQESWGVKFTLDENTRVITGVTEEQGEGA